MNLFSILAYSQQTSEPSISIIIDDLGYKPKEDMLALSLPGPITYAILPHSPYANKISEIAFKNKKHAYVAEVEFWSLSNQDEEIKERFKLLYEKLLNLFSLKELQQLLLNH